MAQEREIRRKEKDFAKMNAMEVLERIVTAECMSEKSSAMMRRIRQAHLSDSGAPA